MGLNGPLDLGQDPLAQVDGGDQGLAVLPRAREARERVEEVGHVGRDLGVHGEEPEVLVEPRGLGVVVAGPHVHVVPHALALAPDHQQRLGVRL